MTTNNTSNTPNTFHFHRFFNEVLQQCIKKYKLDPIESSNLKSIYFFYFYKMREDNQVLDEDICTLDFETLKQSSYDCVQIFKKDNETKISHEYIVTKFREKLSMLKKESNIRFELNSFHLDISNTESVENSLLMDEEIYECSKYILNKFKVTSIPIELFLVLVHDVHLTYSYNQELFERQPKFVNIEMTYLRVTQQLDAIGKTIVLNDKNEPSIRVSPPMKNDLKCNLQVNTLDCSCSLKLLTSYFGDKSWHELLIGYDQKNETDYFCFNEEPLFQVTKNTRQFKEVILDTDCTTKFLSNELQDEFFKIWDARLKKEERGFFHEYIKPPLLNKDESIVINISDHKKIDVKKIVNGIWDTSGFEYGTETHSGFTKVITSFDQNGDALTLNINKTLYTDNENVITVDI